MRKFFLIAIKDLKLAFRDRAALIFMLLAPFALTLGMGAVTGRFSGGSSTGLIFPSSLSTRTAVNWPPPWWTCSPRLNWRISSPPPPASIRLMPAPKWMPTMLP